MKYTIKDVQELANSRSGRCLSHEYIPRIKLIWECSLGHTWEARWDHVRKGSWCPKCAHIILSRERRGYDIDDMRKIANKRNGHCLSSEYINAHEKLEWKCSDGHIWQAIPSSILRGSWCPHCRYLGERKCRYVFEMLFNAKFPKTRIEGDTGILILDGYCGELKVAFEYQGQQHYRYMPHLHKSEKKFAQYIERDKIKAEWCRTKCIQLIVVPYWKNNDDQELSDFIGEVTGKNGKIDWSDFYSTLSVLRELGELANARNGKLISRQYLGTMKKLEWECSEGHKWEAVPDSIKRGSWCPYCAGNIRLDLSDIQQLAEARGGRCLSDSYKNLHTKMEFECSQGHKWFAKPNNIKQLGQWCPICSRYRRWETRRQNEYNDINKEN